MSGVPTEDGSAWAWLEPPPEADSRPKARRGIQATGRRGRYGRVTRGDDSNPFLGVHWIARKKKYRAKIDKRVNGKLASCLLGYFKTAEQAAEVRDYATKRAAVKAPLNFPEKGGVCPGWMVPAQIDSRLLEKGMIEL